MEHVLTDSAQAWVLETQSLVWYLNIVQNYRRKRWRPTACPSVFITGSLEANGWTEQYLQSLPKLVSSILLTMLLVPNTSTMVNFMIAPPGSSHKLCLLNFRQWAMAEFPNQWVFKENVCSLFTNSLSMKRSSQKKHLKVKGRGESLSLLFVFHCIDCIPIFRYLNTEQG